MPPPNPNEGEGVIKVHTLVLPGHQGRRLFCFCPFCHKVYQCMGHDCHLWDIRYVKIHEFESSLDNPSCGEAVPNNFPEPV
jgi:hypothetical protein